MTTPEPGVTVSFRDTRPVEGPLSRFETVRPAILGDVVGATVKDLAGGPLDTMLGEALYAERVRMKRNRPNWFTRGRAKGDARLWAEVQAGLLRGPGESDRRALLEAIARHYAEEVGGHFKPGVYDLSTRLVPLIFNGLLNTAQAHRVLPWKMTESLSSTLLISGRVPELRKLSQRGTILMVPTHQSNLDSILVGFVIHLMGLPPFSYGAGLNLFSNPLLSFFMSNLGAYTVDRQKSNLVYKTLLKHYSARILREGIHSIFFPGGGRCRSGAVESHLKLGLLGTGLEAELRNHLEGRAKPRVFVVPMVMSYHFVLEAATLIEDYLADAGKARFIISDDEFSRPGQVVRFFWKLFQSKSSVAVRIGRPMDVFGNDVDEEGESIGPNGTRVDPRRWLSTRGELAADPQRDREYTHELGRKLVTRFHEENTVLSSHAVAFAFFEALRGRYPSLDLFRFLRLSRDQRAIPWADFRAECGRLRDRLVELERQGRVHVEPSVMGGDLDAWVAQGIAQVGLVHEARVLLRDETSIWTEDMNLLYYYRNRLTGYALSRGAVFAGTPLGPGEHDAQRFLA